MAMSYVTELLSGPPRPLFIAHDDVVARAGRCPRVPQSVESTKALLEGSGWKWRIEPQRGTDAAQKNTRDGVVGKHKVWRPDAICAQTDEKHDRNRHHERRLNQPSRDGPVSRMRGNTHTRQHADCGEQDPSAGNLSEHRKLVVQVERSELDRIVPIERKRDGGKRQTSHAQIPNRVGDARSS